MRFFLKEIDEYGVTCSVHYPLEEKMSFKVTMSLNKKYFIVLGSKVLFRNESKVENNYFFMQC